MQEHFNLIKQKASVLKEEIEAKLKSFRDETGYTPMVHVETKIKKTNDRDIVVQSVGVTVTVQ